MANRKISLMSEKYLNDASESILSNLTRAVRERAEQSIWGPPYAKTDGGASSIHRNVDDVTFRIRTENQNSDIPTNEQMPHSSNVNHKKRTMSENGKLENSRKNPALGTKRNGDLLDKFADWCNKRHTEFKGNKSKTLSKNSVNCSPSFKIEQKIISESKECLIVKQKHDNCNVLISHTSNEQTVERQTKPNNFTMNGNKKKNTPNNIRKENHVKAFGDEDFANKKKESLKANKDLNLLSIKLINENDEKSYEYIKKLPDILRIKRKYPKLLEIIPDIDADRNEINYSIEAVNIILRYV